MNGVIPILSSIPANDNFITSYSKPLCLLVCFAHRFDGAGIQRLWEDNVTLFHNVWWPQMTKFKAGCDQMAEG